MTKEVTEAVRVYGLALAWWFINADSPHTPHAKIDAARMKLEKAETFLLENGLSEAQLDAIGDRAEAFSKLTMDKMSPKQQELFMSLHNLKVKSVVDNYVPKK